MSDRICSVDECEKPVQARGWCNAHYRRWYDEGHTCSVEDCDGRRFGRGWCAMHYTRWKRHGDPAWEPDKRKLPCSIEGCGKPSRGHGWCGTHYQRWYCHGDPNDAGTRGQGTIDAAGYRRMKINKRFILQHRLVMEEHIGRPLLRCESVHHLNGQRADNRIENLELWSSSQPKGQRVVDKVAWAREILALYG